MLAAKSANIKLATDKQIWKYLNIGEGLVAHEANEEILDTFIDFDIYMYCFIVLN